MRIVVSGGTGFLGRPLVDRLASDGHDVVVLTRSPRGSAGRVSYVTWDPEGADGWSAALAGADAVVNLAGEPIGDKRWTAAQKARIRRSRVQATRRLVDAMRPSPPAVFVSGSAVGFYGDRGSEVLTEQSAPGTDFLADVCVEWETEARRADAFTRVVLIRTGLAIERDGGALGKLLPLFQLFVGGPLGSGRQYWPWIHRGDWIALVRFAIASPDARGPINGTAPAPVTNAEFSKALGRALNRPAFLPAPRIALGLMLGEMADALLFSSQRAIPERAQALGFQFTYREIDEALRAITRPT